MLRDASITGFAAANLPPQWTAESTKFSIAQNAQLALNLRALFQDPEGQELTFITTQTENLDVQLAVDQLTITPEPGFIGERIVTVIASDGQQIASKRLKIEIGQVAQASAPEPAAAAPEQQAAAPAATEPVDIALPASRVIDKIEDAVEEALAEEELVEVIIILKDPQTFGTAAKTRKEVLEDKKEKAEQTVDALLEKVNDVPAGTTQEANDVTGAAIADVDMEVVREYETVNAIAVRLTRSGLEKLRDDPTIEQIVLDREYSASLSDSVPLIDANDVWNLTVNSTNVTGLSENICVIDTGLDLNHSAFISKIVGGYDYVNEDGSPQDDSGNSHGTHVSGIAAGNSSAVKGVAPGARIIPVKVCNSGNSCTASDILAGIDYCNNNSVAFNVTAISGSLGDNSQYNSSTCPSLFDSALNTSNALGIIPVFASGNNYFTSGVSYPACSPYALSVGSVSKSDAVSSFSNRGGDRLDIMAPGESITSAVIGGTGSLSGTSMSTPHVSGVIALVQQNQRLQGKPILTLPQLRQLFKETGKIVETWNRIDAYAAIVKLNQNYTINITDNSVTNATPPKAKVKFKDTTDLSRFAECAEVKHNFIDIDSADCPQFNKSAHIVLEGIGGANATPLRNGQPCPSTVCQNVTFGNGTLEFDVTEFTNYSSESTFTTQDVFTGCPVLINTSSNLTANITATINAAQSCITFGNSNIILDCLSFNITSNGTGTGINATNRNNITIRNCVVQNFSLDIFGENISNSAIVNNIARNGTGIADPDGGSGIRIRSSRNVYINNNTGSAAVSGIGIHSVANVNLTLSNNTAIAGTGGLFLDTTIGTTIISSLSINTAGGDGIILTASSANNTLTNCIGMSATGIGITLDGSQKNNITNCTGTSVTGRGLSADANSGNNTFINSTFVSSALAVELLSSANVLNGTIIRTNGTYLLTSGNAVNNFTNTLFDAQNGSVQIFGNVSITTGTNISGRNLNITFNAVRLNSTNVTFLNQSAQITLRGITALDPKPIVDFEDDGTFIDCPASICTEVSFSGGIYVYNVTQFTTYSSNDTFNSITGCPIIINTSSVLTQNIATNVNSSCITFGTGNITLDCQGFTLRGNNSATATGSAGINSTFNNNITITNCVVVNFTIYISVRDSNNSIFTNLRGQNASVAGLGNGMSIIRVRNSYFNNITASYNGSFAAFDSGFGANNTYANITGTNINDGGVRFAGEANSSISNIIGISDAAGTGVGVNFDSTTDNNITNILGISNTSSGILIQSSGHRNRVSNITGRSTSGSGIRITDSLNNVLRNATGISRSGIGFSTSTVAVGTKVINSTFVSNGFAMDINAGAMEFNDTIIRSNLTWIETVADTLNFTNLKFETPEGSIRIFGNATSTSELNITTRELNVSFNRARLNSSFLPFFNQSGQVILLNFIAVDPSVTVDFNDDGIFEPCSPSICTVLETSDARTVFNVTRFTTYSMNTTGVMGCPVVLNNSASLTNNIVVSLTPNQFCILFGANNIELNCAGFIMTADANGTAINATDRLNVTVRNCRINNFTNGIFLLRTNSSLAFNNTITNATSSYIRLISSRNNTIANNIAPGTSGDTIRIDTNSNNNTIANNTATSGSAGEPISITGSAENTFRGNNFTDDSNQALSLSVNRNTLINNFFHGTGPGLIISGTHNTLINNTVISTGSDQGIQVTGDNNNLSNNTGIAGTAGANPVGIQISNGANNILDGNNGTSTDGVGIEITGASATGNILRNNRGTSTASSDRGIAVITGDSNVLINNVGIANGTGTNSEGIGITSSQNNLTNNTGISIRDDGLLIQAGPNRLYNNTFESGSLTAIRVTGASNFFNGTTIRTNASWIITTAAALFVNTLFDAVNGSISFSNNFTIPTSSNASLKDLNITFNRIRLNSTALSFLNTSAQISLRNITFGNPETLVDFEDDGTFINCPSTICSEVSFVNGFYVFNVTRFTSFTSTAGNLNLTLTKTDTPDPVNRSSNLSYTIVINITSNNASNISLTDIYPSQVIFQSAQPTPITGTNNTFIIGNLTEGTAVFVNISVFVRNVSNGTIITNTANITFQNSTGTILTANVTENTTVVAPQISIDGCPVTINDSAIVTQNLTSNRTCVVFGADGITLDCQNFAIVYGIAGQNDSFGINVTNREDAIIRNCRIFKGNVTNGARNYGIGLFSTPFALVENNNIFTNGSGSNEGIHAAGLANTQSILVNNPGDVNSPFCTGAEGLGTCNTCFTTGGVDCAFLGQGGCTDGEGFKTDTLLRFNTTAAPTGGSIQIIGGEAVFCNLNGNQITSISTRNNCGSFQSSNILASAFVIGENNLTCSVAGSGSDEDNGFKLSYFSYNALGLSPNNLTIRNNNVTADGGNNSHGIFLDAANSTVARNNITATGDRFGHGISLDAGARSNAIVNNSIAAQDSGADAIHIFGGVQNIFFNNTIGFATRAAAHVEQALNNTFNASNLPTPTSLFVVETSGTINYTAAINFTNGTNLADLVNLTLNRTLVNTTRVQGRPLNRSAVVTFFGITSGTTSFAAQPFVDFEDDTTFASCISPQCTNTLYNSSSAILSYSVASFTTYSSSPLSGCGTLDLAINESEATFVLNTNLVANNTCFTIAADNITIDCNNTFSVTYATVGPGNAIRGSNITNFRLRNCTLILSNTSRLPLRDSPAINITNPLNNQTSRLDGPLFRIHSYRYVTSAPKAGCAELIFVNDSIFTGNASCDNITIRSNVTITINNTAAATNSSVVFDTVNFILSVNATISANAIGFPGGPAGGGDGQGPGAGTSSGGGAGHGSRGGTSSGAGGSAYGSSLNPNTVGSGGAGGTNIVTGGGAGGAGGGAISLFATRVTIEGTVSADGVNGVTATSANGGGGGAGGTINIIANIIEGNGTLNARGGTAGGSTGGGTAGGGGSGGRIMVRFNTSTFLITNASVNGGASDTPGTLAFLDLDDSILTIRQGWRWQGEDLGIWNFTTINMTDASTRQTNGSLNLSPITLIANNGSISTERSAAVNFTLNITVTNLTITTGSTFDLSGAGFAANIGPGAGTLTSGSTSGAGHGGIGGTAGSATGGSPYDSSLNPFILGSGGGTGTGAGGAGGGTVLTRASRTLFNGTITVNGGAGTGVGGSGSASGAGGAGGTINILTNTFEGTGALNALGGAGGSGFTGANSGGSGAGGRIMVRFNTSTVPITNASVVGGSGGASTGDTGTLAFLDLDDSILTIRQGWRWQGEDLGIWNFTIINLTDASTRQTNGSLNLSPVTLIANNGSISTERSAAVNFTLNITVTNLTITTGSTFDLSGAGFAANIGPGAGVLSGGATSGAGHGGNGGSAGSATGGSPYDSSLNPFILGSGGGAGTGAGGGGGGMIVIRTSRATINGTLNANGGAGTGVGGPGSASGAGGAGGTITILTDILDGTGTMIARGGSGGVGFTGASSGGGGGGGRIIARFNASTFLIANASVSGGSSSATAGDTGTLGFLNMNTSVLTLSEGWRWQLEDQPFNFTNITANNLPIKSNDSTITATNVFFANNASWTIDQNSTVVNATRLTLANSTITATALRARFSMIYTTLFEDTGTVYTSASNVSLENRSIARVDWNGFSAGVGNLSRNTRLGQTTVFVNSSNQPGLNVSANVTVFGIVSFTAQPTVDFEDDGSFIACPATICTRLSAGAGGLVFNVTQFTTYSATDLVIELVKNDNPDPVNASSNLSYAIIINVTIGNVSNITLTETYPNQTIFLNSSPPPVSGTNNTFIVGNLTAGQARIVNITVLVRNITNGTLINNTVNITFQNSTGAIITLNDTENTTVLNPPLVNFSNVSITKTDSPDPVNTSSNLTYRINVTNTGNGTAYNVTINDTYPLQIIFLTAQPSPLAGTNNTFILGNLTPGTNISINITLLVLNVSNNTILNNTANVTFNNETGASLSAIATQNTTVQNLTIIPLFNLSNVSITKTDSPDSVNVNNNLTYQINVTSTGNGTAFNVTVNDTYPSQIIFLSASPTPISGTNNTFVLGNLTPGRNISVNITVLVLNITNNTLINNTANVTFQNETGALLRAAATASTTVLNNPVFNVSNISVSKTDSPDPVENGTQLSYTITITSSGNGTAFNVTVNDTYPGQVIFSSASPTPLSGTNNTFILGNLTPGTTVVINITVNVTQVLSGTVLNNTANVTFRNETGALLSVFDTESTTTQNTTVTPSAPPAGGGGGSGGAGAGGVSAPAAPVTQLPSGPACLENWECDGWSACVNGLKVRTCADLNNCNTTRFLPATRQACIAPQLELVEQPLTMPAISEPVAEPVETARPLRKIEFCAVLPFIIEGVLIVLAVLVILHLVLAFLRKENRKPVHVLVTTLLIVTLALLVLQYIVCKKFLPMEYITFVLLVLVNTLIDLMGKKEPIVPEMPRVRIDDGAIDRLESFVKEARRPHKQPKLKAVKRAEGLRKAEHETESRIKRFQKTLEQPAKPIKPKPGLLRGLFKRKQPVAQPTPKVTFEKPQKARPAQVITPAKKQKVAKAGKDLDAVFKKAEQSARTLEELNKALKRLRKR